MKSRNLQGAAYLALAILAVVSSRQWWQSADVPPPARHLTQMTLTDWLYKRTLTDANATAVADYAVCVLLDASNFDFSRANSDGSDLRFWDATEKAELPYWIKEYDAVGESAEVWVRVADTAHTLEMYYGNAEAGSRSVGQSVFDTFSDFDLEEDAAIPFEWRRVGTFNASNRIEVSSAQGLPGRVHGTLAASTSITAGSGPDAYTQARVPHQRQCFYAAGRCWVFWADYSGGGTGLKDLYFRSSLDGNSWSSDTLLTTIPRYDAQWAVHLDTHTGKLHVAKNIQTQMGTPFHDGMLYRRGTPGSDGTISWDAVWQIAIPVGNAVGDFCLTTDSEGQAWIGYGDGDSYDPGAGNAVAIKNGATDGTWITAEGFPAVVHAGVHDDAFVVLAPLLDGEMYGAVYEWDNDVRAQGYAIGPDGSIVSEGAVTTKGVEADSGTGAKVGRIEIASHAGDVHLVYFSASESGDVGIFYRRRTASGAWEDELRVGRWSHTETEISSPRLSFDRSLSGIDIHVLWTTSGGVYHAAIINGGVQPSRLLIAESLQGTYEHAMPAEWTDGHGGLQLVYLASNNTLKHALLDVRAVSIARKSLLLQKASTASFTNQALRDVPDRISGVSYDFDFYVASMSSAANDNIQLANISNTDTTAVGPAVLFFGDTNQLGYTDGTLRKVASCPRGAWHSLSIRLKPGSKYDLALNGAVVESDAQFLNNPTELTLFRALFSGNRTGVFYLDNFRVRPWIALEPSISVGSEQSTDEPSFRPALLRRTRVIGAGTL